jgi:hypothetical protein
MHDIVFTTDNAPAVAKAMDLAKVVRIPCCAHVTSLAVKRVNKNVQAVSKWKKNVVGIVGNFRHSNANMDLLLQEQREAGVVRPKKPTQEGETRWNSTEVMLSTFKDLYQYITSVSAKHLITEVQ